MFTLISCGVDDPEIEKKYVAEEVEQKQADDEELLTRLELINRLKFSGLSVDIRSSDYTPNSLKEAFPAKPKEHFMMSLNDELFWVSRFNTIGQAKLADYDFDDGFRFSNWHFAGQITIETSNLIVKALETDQKTTEALQY
ncbi:MAG: hypothetical protein L3J52_05850 [Proteobacteria bacterium]|nr:hypothetical protein [Pseudomonadota bacterium]